MKHAGATFSGHKLWISMREVNIIGHMCNFEGCVPDQARVWISRKGSLLFLKLTTNLGINRCSPLKGTSQTISGGQVLTGMLHGSVKHVTNASCGILNIFSFPLLSPLLPHSSIALTSTLCTCRAIRVCNTSFKHAALLHHMPNLRC